MIPIPPFPSPSAYLFQTKKLFLHGNISDCNVESRFSSEKEKEFKSLFVNIIDLEDFGDNVAGKTLFEKLILAPFPVLQKIHKKFHEHQFQTQIIKNERKIWVVKDEWRIFLKAYDRLVSRHLNSWLVDQYGIKCCPYCNENFVFNRGDKASAQLDHFFPKDKYPLFAVSLYNLVPACPACNHIKRESMLGVSPHDNKRDFDQMRISYTPKVSSWMLDHHTLDVIFRFGSSEEDREFEQDMKKNIACLKLEPAYQNHRDYVQEIINKAFWYNDAATEAFRNSLPGVFGSEGEMLRMVFGNYAEPKDFLKRPLSKLTGDLLLELGVLNMTKKRQEDT